MDGLVSEDLLISDKLGLWIYPSDSGCSMSWAKSHSALERDWTCSATWLNFWFLLYSPSITTLNTVMEAKWMCCTMQRPTETATHSNPQTNLHSYWKPPTCQNQRTKLTQSHASMKTRERHAGIHKGRWHAHSLQPILPNSKVLKSKVMIFFKVWLVRL